MGRKNFDKRFREEFGTSPAHWVQQETAKRLRLFLMEPGITISDAMDKFHFNSPSHFNRFCRRYFNESPGVMLKKAQATAKNSKKSKKN
jgi:AraC-like DNA-binding protein